GEGCALSVVDGIKINGALVRPLGASGDTPLEQSASGHLNKYMGEQAQGITVTARTNGQVTVAGTVGSYEEKLAVSQSLRAVAGCTSVVNQLRVGTTQQDGRPHALVSADGRLLVPDTTKPAPPAVKQTAYTP